MDGKECFPLKEEVKVTSFTFPTDGTHIPHIRNHQRLAAAYLHDYRDKQSPHLNDLVVAIKR